jgi:hypothetical protein
LERNAELGISFHVLEQNLLTAAVVEFGGPAVGVSGNSLSGFKSAIIFQKGVSTRNGQYSVNGILSVSSNDPIDLAGCLKITVIAAIAASLSVPPEYPERKDRLRTPATACLLLLMLRHGLRVSTAPPL